MGNLGCGELLLLVFRQVRKRPAGSIIGIVTTDPAAGIDITAWCHLTEHLYHGRASPAPDTPLVVELVRQPTPVDPDRPWHPLPRMENIRCSILVSLASRHDNTDRATVVFVIAGAAAASGQDTTVFLSAEGAWLGKSGEADKIHEDGSATLAELMAGFVEAGGRIIGCSPCTKRRGIAEADLASGAVLAGGAAVVALMAAGAQTIYY